MKKLLRSIRSAHRQEAGITGLETAIILIAFVIVASVFAFVVLSTGLFSAERGKQTVLAGLAKASGNVELRGDVTYNAASAPAVTPGTDTVVFNLSLAAAGTPVNLDPAGTNNTVVINYIDGGVRKANLTYTVNWIKGTGTQLDPGELAEVTVTVPTEATTLDANKTFTLEIVPNSGGTMLVERLLPPQIDSVMDLH
jgi:flagellin FlaB